MDEAHVWDRLARRYDTIVRLFDRSYPKIRQLLADDLHGRGRVLEIAAGTGQFTLDIAAVADEVVATDIAPEMVERLGQSVLRSPVENVRVEVTSAYEIGADDGTFDAVFCANALHVMEEPGRALREFKRVLAEDGVLIAPTFLHGADQMRRLVSKALSVVSPFVAHTRFDLAGLHVLVEEVGFSVIRSEKLPGVFPVGYVAARLSERFGG